MKAKKELIIQWCNEGKLGAVDGDIYTLMELSFKLGVREVVEWIPQLIQGIKDAMWKDDWGVKGVLYEDMLDSLVRKLVKAQLKKWGLGGKRSHGL